MAFKTGLPFLAASFLMVFPVSHAAAQTLAANRPQGRIAVITETGALPDGKTVNTALIQKAVDTLAVAGGGTIVVPEGTFLTGSLFLKPGVNLHLEKNGILKGTTDIKDYPKTRTRIEGHFQEWIPALINAESMDHLRITGEGTLDGSGQPFWTAFRSRIAADRSTKNLDVERPRLVFLQNCRDVQVRGIHFKDSGFWNLHVYKCREVMIENLDITAGTTSPSTDGMDIDSSQDVTIRGCHIAVNDDCIALKGSKGPLAMEDKDSPPVEHIRISDCKFERGGSFITCGSEATVVRDVLVENCAAVGQANRGMAVLRLKMRTDTPQLYEDIHFKNITLEGAGAIVNITPWSQYFDLQGRKPPTRAIRNISMSDIKGTFGTFGTIAPPAGDTIDHVTFENIDVKVNGTPKISGVTHLVMKNVKINGADYAMPGDAGK